MAANRDINQFLVTESGRLTYDIYIRTQYTSPWISQPKKTAWPEGMGDELKTIMWERPYVADAAGNDVAPKAWGKMTMNEGQAVADGETSNSCIPPVDLVNFSQTFRTTSLYHKAVHSPRFCVFDLLNTAKRDAQMKAVQDGLADQVRLEWIEWNRDGYTKLANKYVAGPGMHVGYKTAADGLLFPQTMPTSILTNGILDYFTGLLLFEQGHRHALSNQNGAPVFGLITDQITSRNLIRADDAIRQDFRYAEPDKLLKPLGVTHTYNGYVHMLDEAPPRYTFDDEAVGDKFIRVPHYIVVNDAGSTSGKKKIVNPAWITAPIQDSYIYVKDAYQLRVPGSITSVSQANFKPQNYMGDFKFLNEIDLNVNSPMYNPDGKMGFFRGVMAAGVEPIAPHVMFVIRHLVCPTNFGLLDCDFKPVVAAP